MNGKESQLEKVGKLRGKRERAIQKEKESEMERKDKEMDER